MLEFYLYSAVIRGLDFFFFLSTGTNKIRQISKNIKKIDISSILVKRSICTIVQERNNVSF